jgi:hypothetical protein
MSAARVVTDQLTIALLNLAAREANAPTVLIRQPTACGSPSTNATEPQLSCCATTAPSSPCAGRQPRNATNAGASGAESTAASDQEDRRRRPHWFDDSACIDRGKL